jgi:hypothetical protein
MTNFTLEHVFYQFLRGIVSALVVGALGFGVYFGLESLGTVLAGLPLLLAVVTVFLVIFVVNLTTIADGFYRKKLAQNLDVHFLRACGQLLFFGLVSLLMLVVATVLNASNFSENAEFTKFMAIVAVFSLVSARFWFVNYQQSELKNLELTSAMLATLVAVLGFYFIRPEAISAPIVGIILAACWFVLEAAIYSFSYLFYFGLNNFYGAEFWHYLPTKKDEPSDQQ